MVRWEVRVGQRFRIAGWMCAAGVLCAGCAEPPSAGPQAAQPERAEAATSAAAASVADAPSGPGNVLVFIADDLGVDRLSVYGIGEEFPYTPTIDALAADGVRFDRVWAQSLCSPGRAAILTGRQPYQTLVGHALSAHSASPLGDEETTIAELIAQSAPTPYATGYIGKWHLSSKRLGDGYETNPNDQGFDSFAGLLVGLDDETASDELPQGYFDWERTENGVNNRSSVYVTTVNANDAIDAIQTLPEPWVVYVAFMAPHAPLHWPPDRLWSGDRVGSTDQRQKTNAMIEAMDHEMQRVLDALGPAAAHTTVMFTADNGTEGAAVSAPYPSDRAKGTPYEGGLRVPLIASGYRVGLRGVVGQQLVQTSDLFATVADLAGVPADAVEALDVDSVSLVPAFGDVDAPVRSVAFSEEFEPSGPGPYTEHELTIRDERYKLVWAFGEQDGEEMHLYRLDRGAVEGEDLLAQPIGPARAQVEATRDRLLAWLPTTL